MFEIILDIHSIVRWLVVLIGLWAVIAPAWWGLFVHRDWNAWDRKSGLFFNSALDFQLLLGVLLFILQAPGPESSSGVSPPPCISLHWDSPSFAMSDLPCSPRADRPPGQPLDAQRRQPPAPASPGQRCSSPWRWFCLLLPSRGSGRLAALAGSHLCCDSYGAEPSSPPRLPCRRSPPETVVWLRFGIGAVVLGAAVVLRPGRSRGQAGGNWHILHCWDLSASPSTSGCSRPGWSPRRPRRPPGLCPDHPGFHGDPGMDLPEGAVGLGAGRGDCAGGHGRTAGGGTGKFEVARHRRVWGTG